MPAASSFLALAILGAPMPGSLVGTAPVTFFFLVLNVIVGGYTLFVRPDLIDRWSFRPYAAARGEWSRWLTAGVVHVGLGHLAFNMITLWSLGPVVEFSLGPLRFLAIYVVSELCANALTFLRHRANPAYSAVGASGAISGVVFAFVLLYPLEKLYLFFVPVGIPAALFALIYVGLSVYAAQQGGGRIAHEAHLGGALGGVLATLLLAPGVGTLFLAQLFGM